MVNFNGTIEQTDQTQTNKRINLEKENKQNKENESVKKTAKCNHLSTVMTPPTIPNRFDTKSM